MRMVTNTNTGKIVSDIDLCLEYLYVGDYGKENNIKADFLGYTKRIDKVKHKPVDITDKLVVTVSSQKERDRIVDAFSAIPSVYHVSNEDMKNALEKADKADEKLQEFKKAFESYWKEK